MPMQSARESHHARIVTEMRRKILKGQWAPGHQLDKETGLAEHYGVSRMTMNRALTQLSREGFLVRRKRSGTFVATPRTQSAFMEIGDIGEEVAALGQTYSWQLLSRSQAMPGRDDIAVLELEDGATAPVLLLCGLHYAGDTPFCLERRAINLGMVADAASVDFQAHVPGQWLLRSIPWSTAHHRVRAVNAAGKDAAGLGLASATACLEILRRTRIERDWVTHVRLLYPGQAHQLIAEFAPSDPDPTP